MIQRIQTLYLAIAAVFAGGLTNLFSFFSVAKEKIELLDTFNFDSVLVKSVGIFFVLSTGLSLLSILKFKQRQQQFVMNRVNILINFYLLSVLLYLTLALPGEINISEKGIGVYLPLAIVVLLVIANKAIKKDEDLVKSVDRIR